MKPSRLLTAVSIPLLSLVSLAQFDKLVIPAGTPEDQALQAISKEEDAAKKLPMYEDFVQKFAANPTAVAYGNWQISQYYQNAGDLRKAFEYGEKALAGSPHSLDILVSETGIAQQLKENAKTVEYAARGGEAYNSLQKQVKPEGMSDEDFTTRIAEEKAALKSSYEFLEVAAYNAIAGETNAKARMSSIERFTLAFPGSRFEEPVTSYAMMSLSELNDTARLVAFGEKTLATNPESLPALLLLAGVYSDDNKPGSLPKAITYAQKAISVAKAEAPDAERSRKLSSGAAHSTLGYVYMKQDKTTAAVPELKNATLLLKGLDDQQYAIALYRLGFAYAKLNKVTEAREVLNEAVKITGPVQQSSRDLLAKVNAARAQAK
jgi:tetratricopeptide (TPR) repeat protein